MTTIPGLRAALHHAGIPDDFSVVPVAQTVSRSVAREIDNFIEVFDRVTTRPRWQRVVSADGPEWARQPRREVCFFSAWDFHAPDDGRCQLIEFNDNGSGFYFASILNRAYFDVGRVASDSGVEAPPTEAVFDEHLVAMIEPEARLFFGARPEGLVLILDDAESLVRGHFRVEHELLASLLRNYGWQAAIGAPEELTVSGHELHHRGRGVSFVVNRSTDFLWRADAFEPLRRCFAERSVYVAPNPFTYLTRSDKRLLELLSVPDRDEELGIEPDERAVLGERIPKTRLLRESNLDELAGHKHELFFKPAHGYASHGTISGANVGRSRLHRLLRGGEPYVAQRFVSKRRLELPGAEAEPLYADLRIWAYRGQRYLVSGRASRSEERNDLSSGGWIPTFVSDG